MNTAVKVNGIEKNFETTRALDGISFDVEVNEVFGLVGPDGAGKTTTIRILCGLIIPDSGNAEILAYDLRKDINKVRKEIGYLSQKFSLYGDLSVDENIEFFAEIHGVKNFQKRRDELLDFTRLTPFRERLAGRLSGGMKQKLALACTLIHTPKIIFLDEPTTGVDPVSRREFWKILSNLVREGVTIIISTPYLDEAERFSRIALIEGGKILKSGTPAEIKSDFKKQIIEIVCSDIWRAYSILKKETDYELQLFGDRIDAVAENYEKDFSTIGEILERHNIKIYDHRLKPVSLENVFISLMDTSTLDESGSSITLHDNKQQ